MDSYRRLRKWFRWFNRLNKRRCALYTRFIFRGMFHPVVLCWWWWWSNWNFSKLLIICHHFFLPLFSQTSPWLSDLVKLKKKIKNQQTTISIPCKIDFNIPFTDFYESHANFCFYHSHHTFLSSTFFLNFVSSLDSLCQLPLVIRHKISRFFYYWFLLAY